MGHRSARNLFHEFRVDSPHVTEIRRLLQGLAREEHEGSKVYMITSSSRGEGKSTICGLLALGAAHFFRKRTLIIDGDFRRPTLHELLGIHPQPGLFELMHKMTTLDLVIRATPLPTLFAMGSGRPVEPLHSAYVDEEFASILAQVRPQYDFIFVDSPPVVPVAEPLFMAEHADALLVVAMAGHTPLTFIRRMRQILDPLWPKVRGIVLNNVSEGLPYYYEHRYYGYGHPKMRRIRTTATPSPASPEEPSDSDRRTRANP